jgi:hypothetical protein
MMAVQLGLAMPIKIPAIAFGNGSIVRTSALGRVKHKMSADYTDGAAVFLVLTNYLAY